MKIENLIKQELDLESGHTVDPVFAQLYLTLEDMRNIAVQRNQAVKRKEKHSMSLKELDITIKQVLSALDEAEKRAKLLRSNAATRPYVPVGLARYIRRFRTAASDVHSVTVGAPKAQRFSPGETADIILQGFDLKELGADLLKQAAVVERHVLKTRMGESQEADKAHKAITGKYQRSYNKLPTAFEKGEVFSVVEMPIVPLFANMATNINPEPLRRAGVKVTQIGDGFMVLEKQTLLAFDRDAMGWKSGLKKTRAGTTKSVHFTADRLSKTSSDQSMDLFKVLERINERSAVPYDLASATFVANPRNPKMWFAWIMPRSQVRRMRFGVENTGVEWDFPFSMKFSQDED